jgi:glutamine synthetase
VGVFDVDGIFRGKYMAPDKLASALAKGFGFCDVVMGWDSSDQLYDNTSFTGWHTAYPDAEVRLLPETERAMPVRRRNAAHPRGVRRPARGRLPARDPAPGARPRRLDRLQGQGRGRVRVLRLRGDSPFGAGERLSRAEADHAGQFRLFDAPLGGALGFLPGAVVVCEEMRIELEGLHTETGPGVLEAAIRVDDALEAADKAALFKTILKILCQRRGWMATFMAKWSRDWPGQSGHLHSSLLDSKSGDSIFYDPDDKLHMSERMRWYVGGQQALMPELLAMVSPTVNSYTRLIPGFWAPTAATWGYENRTCALRVIGGSASSQRVEYRIAAADINPYIALAAAIGSGLWGIENRIEPDAPIAGNAYEQESPERALPSTLWDAAQRLRASEAARELFGAEFVDHYAATREWEERERARR